MARIVAKSELAKLKLQVISNVRTAWCQEHIAQRGKNARSKEIDGGRKYIGAMTELLSFKATHI